MVDHKNNFASDVLSGLSATPKFLLSMYFYDEKGSNLFEQIMQAPEYYLTGCEYEILYDNRDEFLKLAGNGPFNLVELGAGNGEKTGILLDHFTKAGLDFRYVPIDISQAAIETLGKNIRRRIPTLNWMGLVREYFEGLEYLKELNGRSTVVLFMGSNIGNLDPTQRTRFLQKLWLSLLPGDRILTGFDMVKDYDIIRKAYDDGEGITAQFNLNLLNRINRELDGNFDPGQFRYYSIYNPVISAHEAFLFSQTDQEVFIGGLNKKFFFKKGEAIHTEYSFKFTRSQIEEMASENGFNTIQNFTDSREYFMISAWEVVKDPLSKPSRDLSEKRLLEFKTI